MNEEASSGAKGSWRRPAKGPYRALLFHHRRLSQPLQASLDLAPRNRLGG